MNKRTMYVNRGPRNFGFWSPEKTLKVIDGWSTVYLGEHWAMRFGSLAELEEYCDRLMAVATDDQGWHVACGRDLAASINGWL